MSTKPTVHYDRSRPHIIVLGQSAVVFTLDHPSPFVSGDDTPAYTSRVLSVGPAAGEFETENTHYVPVDGAAVGGGV